MTETDGRTPFEADRDRVEDTGKWPEGWGPFHRHFANDAVHRDGGPECDQPGTPRMVYVFDPEFLSVHEANVAEWAAGQLTATLRARVREIYQEADDDGYMDALPPLHQVMLALGAPEDWAEDLSGQPGGVPVTGHDCPCGTPHELSPATAAAYGNVTAGLLSTVTVETPDGRFAVPRIFIACHGLKAADLPALAARYGFERVP